MLLMYQHADFQAFTPDLWESGDASSMNETFILRNIHDEESHDIPGASCLIGRDSSCDIVIDKGHPSRHHARLTWDGERWTLEDLDSTNGTYLNNRRLRRPTALAPGDVIKFGTEAYYFLSARNPEQTIVASKLPADAGAGSSVVSEEEAGSERTSFEQDFPLPPGWQAGDDATDKSTAAAIDQLLKRIKRERRELPEAAVAFRIGEQDPVIYGVSARGANKKWKIGRTSDCNLHFDSSTLSAHHADLVHTDKQWKVVDAGSTNGLRTGGVLRNEVALQDGSRIVLGQVEMFFRLL